MMDVFTEPNEKDSCSRADSLNKCLSHQHKAWLLRRYNFVYIGVLYIAMAMVCGYMLAFVVKVMFGS